VLGRISRRDKEDEKNPATVITDGARDRLRDRRLGAIYRKASKLLNVPPPGSEADLSIVLRGRDGAGLELYGRSPAAATVRLELEAVPPVVLVLGRRQPVNSCGDSLPSRSLSSSG
jgi:hypothetical protein